MGHHARPLHFGAVAGRGVRGRPGRGTAAVPWQSPPSGGLGDGAAVGLRSRRPDLASGTQTRKSRDTERVAACAADPMGVGGMAAVLGFGRGRLPTQRQTTLATPQTRGRQRQSPGRRARSSHRKSAVGRRMPARTHRLRSVRRRRRSGGPRPRRGPHWRAPALGCGCGGAGRGPSREGRGSGGSRCEWVCPDEVSFRGGSGGGSRMGSPGASRRTSGRAVPPHGRVTFSGPLDGTSLEVASSFGKANDEGVAAHGDVGTAVERGRDAGGCPHLRSSPTRGGVDDVTHGVRQAGEPHGS